MAQARKRPWDLRRFYTATNIKLQNSNIINRKYFGSGNVFLYLTGTYMNDPFSFLKRQVEALDDKGDWRTKTEIRMQVFRATDSVR